MLRLGTLLGAALLLTGCTFNQGADGQGGCAASEHQLACGQQVANKSGTEIYTIEVDGGHAEIEWGGQAASGTLSITVTDAAGSQVFQRGISGSGNQGFQEELHGSGGTWTIRLSFSAFTGQMGFTVQQL